MSRKSLVGIMALLVLLIVATGSVNAAVSGDKLLEVNRAYAPLGLSSIKLYDVDIINSEGNYLQYDYVSGDSIHVKLQGLNSDNTTYVAVRIVTPDWQHLNNSIVGAVEWDYSITDVASAEFDIPLSELYPGYFTIEVKSNNVDVFKLHDGSYYDPGSLPDRTKPYNGYLIYVHATKPQITIDLKSTVTTKGDRIVVDKLKVYDVGPGQKVKWYLKGPYDWNRYAQWLDSTGQSDVLGVYENGLFDITNLVGTGGKLSTSFSLPTGYMFTNCNAVVGKYKLAVIVYDRDGSVLTSKAVYPVIEDLDIDITVTPEEPKLGQKIMIRGTTNAAESGSIYDDTTTRNRVDVTLYYPDNTVVKTWANLPVESDGSFDIGGTYLLNLNWPTGSYRITAVVTTYEGIDEDKTIYISIKEPEIEFTMDDYTFTRGESFKIKGKVSVAEAIGVKIYLKGDTFSNLLQDRDRNKIVNWGDSSRDDAEYIYLYTSAKTGEFETPSLHIRGTAAKKSYTIVAKLDVPNKEIVSTTSIRVVKAELKNVSLSSMTLVKGGDLKISGETNLDYVYIWTDSGMIGGDPDKIVFDNVYEIPKDSEKFNINDYPNKPPYTVTVENDRFDVTLTVNSVVKEGNYMLYIIAPSNYTRSGAAPQWVDPTEDPMAQFSIRVLDFGFLDVPDPIKIAKGDEKDLFVGVRGDPDDVILTGELRGHGVKTDEDRMVFTKWNESDGSGYLYQTLYPFYDSDTDALVSEGEPGDQLEPGVYTLTLHLYEKDENGGKGDEVATKYVTLIVEEPVFNVDVPSTVVRGQDIPIKITTNRGEKGYDYIYVVLDLGVDKIKYNRIAVDENGVAEVSIPTTGIEEGTYKIYIRDAMRTIDNERRDIEKWYDISPTDAYAKDYNAQDDILVIKEVTITKAVAPTPTPAPTKTPAPTPTPVETPKPTPTPAPTKTPAPTPTPVETPKPTPTPEKKTPGFEAIFAIAGLVAVAYLLRRRA